MGLDCHASMSGEAFINGDAGPILPVFKKKGGKIRNEQQHFRQNLEGGSVGDNCIDAIALPNVCFTREHREKENK